jgi:transcriptional regulator with AAA-type ATPase domain
MDGDSTARQPTVRVDETQDVVGPSSLAVRWIFPMPAGRLTPLDAARVTLGRDEGEVRLLGKETSRQHAEIRREGPLYIVRDLGSLNGTFVNGARVAESPLAPGDLVRLGEWIGLVDRVPAGGGAPGAGYDTFAPGLYAGPGLSPALEEARKVAPSTLPIVAEGETGTGKEGLCRALHDWSGRPGRFIAVNCGALPEALAEGELFGYRKGAFTGAERGQPGHFRAADRGTLLLDEIVDLPLPLQVKLLRALEQREVVPLGESTPVPVDVRIVAATQGPLGEAVRERRFRADLAARLEGMIIRLPPLRERVADIPFLTDRLFAQHAQGAPVPELDPRLVERLCLHDWPFNVRELDLLVRQLLALHAGAKVLKRGVLPERFQAPAGAAATGAAPGAGGVTDERPGGAPAAGAERRARDRGELGALIAALKTTRGNVARAAALVGMTRQRAYRLMEQRTYDELDEIRAAVGAAPAPGDARDRAPDGGGKRT